MAGTDGSRLLALGLPGPLTPPHPSPGMRRQKFSKAWRAGRPRFDPKHQHSTARRKRERLERHPLAFGGKHPRSRRRCGTSSRHQQPDLEISKTKRSRRHTGRLRCRIQRRKRHRAVVLRHTLPMVRRTRPIFCGRVDFGDLVDGRAEDCEKID